MKKKLSLKELEVQSFITTEETDAKGGVHTLNCSLLCTPVCLTLACSGDCYTLAAECSIIECTVGCKDV